MSAYARGVLALRTRQAVGAALRHSRHNTPATPVNSVRHMSAFQDFVANVKKGVQAAQDEPSDKDTKGQKKAKEAKTADAKPSAEQGPSQLNSAWNSFAKTFAETAEELKKSDFVKQTAKVTEKVAEEAKKTTGEAAAELGKTSAAKKISETAQFLKQELVDDSVFTSAKYQPYRAPTEEDKKRVAFAKKQAAQTDIKEDTESTGMVMHKDSMFYTQWKNFKDNNPIMTRAFEWKMYYDESDNIFIRSFRSITDKISEGLRSMFQESEMTAVLREIRKNDPNFDRENFIEYAHSTLIPVALESYLSGDLETMKEWCSEPTFNALKDRLDQLKATGLKLHYKILDIRDVDIFTATMMDQGPVLTVTCMVQQINYVTNAKGEVVQGDPDSIDDTLYAFAFCREEAPFGHPHGAWRILDMGEHMRRPTW